jgi:uncharacterized membrane protein
MIALSLIPSATIVGMAIVWADGGLAGRAAMRWLVEVVLVVVLSVLVLSVLVLLWKRLRSHRRTMAL